MKHTNFHRGSESGAKMQKWYKCLKVHWTQHIDGVKRHYVEYKSTKPDIYETVDWLVIEYIK